MSDEKKPTASEELNALVSVFDNNATKDSFQKYQDVLSKVTFDQSLYGIKNFGIGDQGTIHRKLRHVLLHYDGKSHTLVEAQSGLKKSMSKIKLQEIKIKKLQIEINEIKNNETTSELDQCDIETKEIQIEMTENDISKIKRELMQQHKLIEDAKTQVDVYKEEIDRLLPLVEEDGRTFEEAESDYWKYRFVRDAECDAKSKILGIDKGVLQSISQLPQSTQEEIIREINKITPSLKGGGVPYEFAYKRLGEGKRSYELAIGKSSVNDSNSPDIIIGCLKRTKDDVSVTDVENMLIIPGELNHRVDYVWGHAADTGRNMIIAKALEDSVKYVFFIDDDTLLPRNALTTLYSELCKYNKTNDNLAAISGHYYKKTEPLESAFLYMRNGKIIPIKSEDLESNDLIDCNGIVAAGCLLIDLEKCKTSGFTLPYFLELRDVDGDMLGTDDIHFTRKSYDHNLVCLVYPEVKCLHIDTVNKSVYGERSDTPYAVNDINIFNKKVKNNPKVVIGTPFRFEDGPENMITKFSDITSPRGYELEAVLPKGLKVAEARNSIVKEALKSNAGYVFFLDDDVKIPPQTLVVLLGIMERQKNIKIIACPYPLKQDGNIQAMLLKTNDDRIVSLDVWEDIQKSKNELPEPMLVPNNWVITMGCTLIDIEVFKNMREPWFFETYRDNESNSLITEDAYFTEKSILSGYIPYMHLGLRCEHVCRNTKKVYGQILTF